MNRTLAFIDLSLAFAICERPVRISLATQGEQNGERGNLPANGRMMMFTARNVEKTRKIRLNGLKEAVK
jgi:hypothetical protein